MHVLLFDIDGTLIRSGGAGKAAMEAGLCSEFGVRELHDVVPYSGRTDTSISRDLLSVHGIEPSDENIIRLRTAYLSHLPATLEKYQGVVLPGIRDLLNRLQSDDRFCVGLLTGNVRAGARCKLSHFDLWQYFPFGAFADDILDRDDVARSALIHTSKHLGRDVHPQNIWVIGDTPLDVRCARAIGARAVAVATGWHSLEELTASKPDHVYSDLANPADLLRAWGIVD